MNINNPTTFSSPALVYSTSNSSGTAGALRADDTLAIFSTTVPTNISTTTVSASTGDNAFGSREDHVHGSTAIIAVASEAEQITGTATSVSTSPGRQQFHTSAPKAWVRINDNGTIVAGSYNVASITDHAVGNRSIVFNVDFANASHVPVVGIIYDAGDGSHRFETFAGGSVQLIMTVGTTLTDIGSGSAHFGLLV